MGKRWTEEDLKKLRPGMVITVPGSAQAETGADRSPANPLAAMQALGRLAEGKMNETEQRYANLLELRKAAGEVLWWAFEPMNLRLAPKTYYKIDFLVMMADRHLEAHEVKGFWTDDALVKIKVAAQKFPFPFVAVRWVKGEWEYRTF